MSDHTKQNIFALGQFALVLCDQKVMVIKFIHFSLIVLGISFLGKCFKSFDRFHVRILKSTKSPTKLITIISRRDFFNLRGVDSDYSEEEDYFDDIDDIDDDNDDEDDEDDDDIDLDEFDDDAEDESNFDESDEILSSSSNGTTPSEENLISWRERRNALERKIGRKRFDDRYEDNPLKADSPTKDYVKEADPFTKQYIAIGNVKLPEGEAIRRTGWIHHMQWVRRSALLPNAAARVNFDYTVLCNNSVTPTSQIVGVRANSTKDLKDLFETEPLQALNALSAWTYFEAIFEDRDELTWDLSTPHIYLGYDSTPLKAKNLQYVNSSITYHSEQEDKRVHRYAHLFPVDIAKTRKQKSEAESSSQSDDGGGVASRLMSEAVGTFIVFTALGMAEGQRYLTGDPIFAKKVYKHQVRRSRWKGNVFQYKANQIHRITRISPNLLSFYNPPPLPVLDCIPMR